MSRPPVEPYPIQPGLTRQARLTWWRAFELTPGVTLRATAHLRPSLAGRADEPWQMLAAVCRAASAALTLHPRLNFYTFWGKLVWAGWPPRVGAVLELPDASCRLVEVADAHLLAPAELIDLLRRERGRPAGTTAAGRLREAWPLAAYAWGRLTGSLVRDYARHTPPVFVSQMAMPEIEAAAFAPAHSCMIMPGWPREGRLPLTICFNHQLANARPVARYLVTVKQLLE